jgi:lipid-A-disaccharide synthase
LNKSVYVVSAEPSGDALSVGLIRELRAREPGLTLHAIGGAAVEAEGFQSAINTTPLSVLGFVEGLRALPMVNKLAMRAVQDIVARRPDAVVLIDSWGFMIRVAKLLKLNGLNTKIIKYVAPQVWAMRRGRAKVLAQYVDHLLCLYPFDVPYFAAQDLPTQCVGNPVLDVDWGQGDGPAFRRRHKIAASDPVLIAAFGSRRAEIERLTEPFLATIRALKAKRPSLVVVAPTVPETAGMLEARLVSGGLTGIDVITVSGETREALAASDVGLLKSGTVTTQAADASVPSVVAYKVSPLTYVAAKALFKADFITIANVCAGTALLPEFIQGDVDPDAMATQLDAWLSDPKAAKARGQALRAVTDQMRGAGGANAKAAEAVLGMLG